MIEQPILNLVYYLSKPPYSKKTTISFEQYLEFLNCSFQSFRENFKGSVKAFVITDDVSIRGSLPSDVEISLNTVDQKTPFMLRRMMAQFEFSCARWGGMKNNSLETTFFLDVDILCVKQMSLSDIQTGGKIGVVCRRGEKYPVNGGLIVLPSENFTSNIAVLESMVREYTSLGAGLKQWYGDQVILKKFVFPKDDGFVDEGFHLFDDRFYFEPKFTIGSALSLKKSPILHFKGYAQRWLLPTTSKRGWILPIFLIWDLLIYGRSWRGEIRRESLRR